MSVPPVPSAPPVPRVAALAILLAGLAGGFGVAFAALAAHLPGGALLSSAALMLLVHAPAFLALALLHGAGLRPLAGLSLAVLALGLALFAGDLAARVFTGARLFAMAAPVGGSLLIAGWAGVALIGLQRLVLKP